MAPGLESRVLGQKAEGHGELVFFLNRGPGILQNPLAIKVSKTGS